VGGREEGKEGRYRVIVLECGRERDKDVVDVGKRIREIVGGMGRYRGDREIMFEFDRGEEEERKKGGLEKNGVLRQHGLCTESFFSGFSGPATLVTFIFRN